MLRIPQSSSITGTSTSDCLGHSMVEEEILPLFRSAVTVLHSPSRLGNCGFSTVLWHINHYCLFKAKACSYLSTGYEEFGNTFCLHKKVKWSNNLKQFNLVSVNKIQWFLVLLCNIKQAQEASPDKASAVRPPTTYHGNYQT